MNQHYLLYQTDCKFFIAPINEEQFAEIEASKEVSVFERQNAYEDTLFSVYLDEEFRFPGHELREIMELWPDDPTIFHEYESNDGISVPYNYLTVIDREYYEESFQGEWEAFLEQLDEVLAQRTFDSLFEKLKPALATAFLEAMGGSSRGGRIERIPAHSVNGAAPGVHERCLFRTDARHRTGKKQALNGVHRRP